MARRIDFRLLIDRLSHISLDVGNIRKYVWALHLVIIFILAKSLSDIFVSYIDHKIEAPPKEAKKMPAPSLPQIQLPELKQFTVILKRNIFNPNAKEEDLLEHLREPKVGLDEAGAIPTSLPLKLVGTIILSDPNRSVAAILDTQKNELESYQVGDIVSGQAKVYKVDAFKVYLQNMQSGQMEFIGLEEEKEAVMALAPGRPSMAPEAGIRETGEDQYLIDRGMLEASLARPDEILTQARAVPNIVGGKIRGFRIFSIRPGSLYEKLGIKNGDVILRVNDVELDSPAKALEFYGAISSASNVTMDVERGGQKRSFSYSIR